MALLTYNWQEPDFNGMLANALHGEQEQRLAAIQQLEQQRLMQERATNIALQLRQEQRMAGAERFRQQLEASKEGRQSVLDDAKADWYKRRGAKSTPSPLFLPEDGVLPSGDSAVAGGAADVLPVDSAPARTSFLNPSGVPDESDRLSLTNPGAFDFSDISAGNPAAADTNIGLDYAAVPESAVIPGTNLLTPNTLAGGNPDTDPTDFSSLMRQGAVTQQATPPTPDADLSGSITKDGMPAGGGAANEPDLMDGARPGQPSRPAQPAQPANRGDAVRSAATLPPEARARVNDVAKQEAAGSLPPGSSAKQYIAEMNELRLQQRQSRGGSGPKVKDNWHDAEGNIYVQMTDGTWQGGRVAPPGSTKVGTGQSESIAQVTEGMTRNDAHNTFVDKNGAEYFVGRGASGKVSLRPYRPDSKPAKLLWGSDGKVYPIGSDGEPMRPVPDGVDLREHSSLKTMHVPGTGVVVVNPDGTGTVMIPEGTSLTKDQKEKVEDDYSAVHDAKDNLAKQEALLRDNPSRTTWFGGGTKAAVDEARKKLNDARDKAARWMDGHPELKPRFDALPKDDAAPAAPKDSGDQVLRMPAESSTSAPFRSADDVKKAIVAGKLSKDAARKILRDQFGFQ